MKGAPALHRMAYCALQNMLMLHAAPEGMDMDVGCGALGGGQQLQVGVPSEVGVDASLHGTAKHGMARGWHVRQTSQELTHSFAVSGMPCHSSTPGRLELPCKPAETAHCPGQGSEPACRPRWPLDPRPLLCGAQPHQAAAGRERPAAPLQPSLCCNQDAWSADRRWMAPDGCRRANGACRAAPLVCPPPPSKTPYQKRFPPLASAAIPHLNAQKAQA